MIEEKVLAALGEAPGSGADLIDRLRRGEPPELLTGAVRIYGALANLETRGKIARLAEGPGEVLWGLPGERGRPLKPCGAPATFGLAPADLAEIDEAVGRITRGLPTHLFEELRRAAVADADRRVHGGERPKPAARAAVDALGPERSGRRLLANAQGGGGVRLRRVAPRRRIWLALFITGALILAVRFFLLGIYRVPTSSMAPALAPDVEGGDQRVLVDLTAYIRGSPARGDLAVFEEGQERYVKRVMGLPGEHIRIGEPDIHIGGQRLVKERSLLERMQVPLFDASGFTVSSGGLRWEQSDELHNGFRRPDGEMLPVPADREPASEVVLSFRLRVPSKPCSLQVTVDAGSKARATIVLSTGRGWAALSGTEIASGPEFTLEPGFWRSVWITNADRVLRVEIDGEEVARAPVPRYDPSRGALCTLLAEGAQPEIEDLLVARDLVYIRIDGENEWRLGPDEYFLLGDNSPNSRDSRVHGPVSRDRLVGRVFAVVWPLKRLRWVK